MSKFVIIAAAAAAALAVPAQAQNNRQADRAAIEQTLRDVYAVISGPPGQKRDFAKMRAMFAPNALLRVIGPKGVRGGTLEDYIAKSGPILEKEGFTEQELDRHLEIYGNLAHAWSSYHGRTASGSFNERGINSFQLVKVDGKWLVASILWQEETPELPLPADMRGKEGSAKK